MILDNGIVDNNNKDYMNKYLIYHNLHKIDWLKSKIPIIYIKTYKEVKNNYKVKIKKSKKK